ncbi:MAG: LamG-like jellyroll fold domain-containing protein [Planctomycetota bacterium]
MHRLHRLITLAILIYTTALPAVAIAAHPDEHDEHHHHHHPRHERVPAQGERFISPRPAAPLELPVDEDSFVFAVFGDRTGGPDEGVAVLAEAVRDVNVIEPDLVMTVGDMIQGYNETPEWMEQMREFKGVMDRLACPWFPVAGNHDVYWRNRNGGERKPEGEHEASYEMHFGPLWYAFEHRDCWFIVLYSDEGNPTTGVKSIRDPESQTMSPEQLNWLKDTLAKAKDARHVFVFLHHPRWIGLSGESDTHGGYGQDWQKVHNELVAAGNVSAVFAGHIHRMRYDPRDGIEYVTMATVGGHQRGVAPQAGYLHQFTLVTVRQKDIALASIPVGEVMDVRAITGQVSRDAAELASVRPQFNNQPLALGLDGRVSGLADFTITNPVDRPVRYTLSIDSPDPAWALASDHAHGRIAPGETVTVPLRVARAPSPIDHRFQPASAVLSLEYRGQGLAVPIPATESRLPLTLPIPASTGEDRTLIATGNGAVRVPTELASIPDGPFTLEAWAKADTFARRTGLVTKTENSEYGLFVNEGRPHFSVHLDGRYVTARSDAKVLSTDRWHHIAGVFDGAGVRLYVDGALVASREGAGVRTTSDLPLYVGADVNRAGQPTSHFQGRIDNVRLSTTARYNSPFTPSKQLETDSQTVALLRFDSALGPWVFNAANPSFPYPELVGDAALSAAPVDAAVVGAQPETE